MEILLSEMAMLRMGRKFTSGWRSGIPMAEGLHLFLLGLEQCEMAIHHLALGLKGRLKFKQTGQLRI